MKKAVGGKSRVDLAVDQIIQVILDRDMKAGDKLPNEYDLARELGVGRSTVREAIKPVSYTHLTLPTILRV